MRGLYLGEVEPQLIARHVFRFGLYADELMIIDPFHNPHWKIGEFNPIENPNPFKAYTPKPKKSLRPDQQFIQSIKRAGGNLKSAIEQGRLMDLEDWAIANDIRKYLPPEVLALLRGVDVKGGKSPPPIQKLKKIRNLTIPKV